MTRRRNDKKEELQKGMWMTLDSRYPAYAGTGSAGMTRRRNDKKEELQKV